MALLSLDLTLILRKSLVVILFDEIIRLYFIDRERTKLFYSIYNSLSTNIKSLKRISIYNMGLIRTHRGPLFLSLSSLVEII